MSGGSMGYIYNKLLDYASDLRDKELTELVKDLAKVFHDCEWWHSADYGENTYRESVANFKQKWFKSDRHERLKQYIDETFEQARSECFTMIQEPKILEEQK